MTASDGNAEAATAGTAGRGPAVRATEGRATEGGPPGIRASDRERDAVVQRPARR